MVELDGNMSSAFHDLSLYEMYENYRDSKASVSYDDRQTEGL